MSKNSFLIVAIVFLFSCNKKKGQGNEPVANNTDTNPIDNLNIQTSSFTQVDTSGVMMFPLSMGETKRDGGSSSYKEIPNYLNWNIIFFNSNTDECHLLTDKKILIRSYDLEKNDEESSYPYIFYVATSFDYNKDKLLTEADPEYLFISDRAGNNFRQISPDEASLVNWEFIKSSNKVLMTVRKDSDKDKEFDYSDEIATFQMDIGKDITAKQVFANDFKNRLKALYDRDWKRLKK